MMIFKKACRLVDIHLRPHDLPRYAATYALRAGRPIEIVSKVILRHANLSTTRAFCRPAHSLNMTKTRG